MITVTLPDGSKREYDAPVTVKQIAESIGTGLAKAALVGKVDGKLVELIRTRRFASLQGKILRDLM